MLHIIIFQVNTFFQIDFYYVDDEKLISRKKKSLFFHFFILFNYNHYYSVN